MSSPARAGLFVYAKDPERVSKFYESVAGMSRFHKTDEITVLESPDIQLLVHTIPYHTKPNSKKYRNYLAATKTRKYCFEILLHSTKSC
jgi:catechol-2,3-dioxygenase